jgi:hypothetical protein
MFEMDLWMEVQIEIQKIKPDNLIWRLEYRGEKYFDKPSKGLSRLREFQTCPSLHDWLSNMSYDAKYDNEEFFKRLCKLITISDRISEEFIEKEKKMISDYKILIKNYIFAITDFHRQDESLITLASKEDLRRFKIDFEKNDLYKNHIERLKKISEIIKKHFVSVRGELPVWGTIIGYVLHADGKRYLVNTNGSIVREVSDEEFLDSFESRRFQALLLV